VAAAFTVSAALLGIWAARRIFLRISRDTLLRAIALMLALTGLSLMLRSMAA
jgi:hypothetical protein